jgi:hypothetical protein
MFPQNSYNSAHGFCLSFLAFFARNRQFARHARLVHLCALRPMASASAGTSSVITEPWPSSRHRRPHGRDQHRVGPDEGVLADLGAVLGRRRRNCR